MNAQRNEQGSVELLVIGYGNVLRSDDGVGPRIVEAVANWQLPGVRTIVCHQLTPELAAPMSTVARVVFVDAAADSSVVQTMRLECEPAGEIMTHAVDPRSLLRLTSLLYGRCPEAVWVTVPARNFEFGQALSEGCAGAMRIALNEIRLLVESFIRGTATRPKNGKALPRQA